MKSVIAALALSILIIVSGCFLGGSFGVGGGLVVGEVWKSCGRCDDDALKALLHCLLIQRGR